MNRASIAISTLVAIVSVFIFRSQILDALGQAAARVQALYNPHSEPAVSRLDTAEIPHITDIGGEDQLITDDMAIPRAIRKVFLAIEQAEGAGARVRRSVGTPQLRNLSPFLMLDHFFVKPGAGFPDQ